MELKPFEIAHLADMDLREPDRRALEGVGDIKAYIDQWTKTGIGFTAFVEDRPLGAGGVVLLRQGVGEVWALTTPLVETHRIAVGRAFMVALPAIVKALKLHRVQVSVQRCHRASRRLVERMGFIEEAPCLHRYGSNGEDYVLYAAYPEG